MARFGKFILGAMVGALFAVAIVMLLTPSSGNDLQKQFKDKVASIRAEMAKAAEDRRAQMQAELEAMRQPKK